MVLARPVYDNGGFLLIHVGERLDQQHLNSLSIYGIRDLVIQDSRVPDVTVQSLVAPELEAAVTQSLRQLITESMGSSSIEDELLKQVETSVYAMVRDSFPEVVGEANANGCLSLQDYQYAQPARVATLSMLIGRKAGYDVFDLTKMGLASLLMNIGYVLVPKGSLDNPDSLMEKICQDIPQHSQRGAEILRAFQHLGSQVVETVEQHHERWDGTGFPARLRRKEINHFARIIAIADTYYELVSLRPDRPAYMPHEAAEFILAYSGELFDPELVQLFSRLIPLYSTGTTVKLSGGEIGIVSNANLGHIARPVVRICYDGRLLKRPFDINLSEKGHQDQLIVEVDPDLPLPVED